MEIWNLLQDKDYIKSIGYTPETLISLFIPNTYELYWNTSGKQFTKRMAQEFEHFWSKERKEKAKALNLSPIEVSTLASIVEAETKKNDEMPKVAGLYSAIQVVLLPSTRLSKRAQHRGNCASGVTNP